MTDKTVSVNGSTIKAFFRFALFRKVSAQAEVKCDIKHCPSFFLLLFYVHYSTVLLTNMEICRQYDVTGSSEYLTLTSME